MTGASAVLLSTAVWHFLAGWHFLVYPERTLRRVTRVRPVDESAVWLFRFLGGLNAALGLFAVLLTRLPPSLVWMALAGFALVNLSQLAIDAFAARSGLAHGAMFRTIFVGDGLIFVLNALAALH